MNHVVAGATVDTHDFTWKFLPVEFFLPGIKIYGEVWFSNKLLYADNAVVALIPDAYSIKTLNFQQLEYIMLLLAMTDLMNFSEKHPLPKIYLDAINQTDMTFHKKQLLEYDRYWTYVLRPTCYKKHT